MPSSVIQVETVWIHNWASTDIDQNKQNEKELLGNLQTNILRRMLKLLFVALHDVLQSSGSNKPQLRLICSQLERITSEQPNVPPVALASSLSFTAITIGVQLLSACMLPPPASLIPYAHADILIDCLFPALSASLPLCSCSFQLLCHLTCSCCILHLMRTAKKCWNDAFDATREKKDEGSKTGNRTQKRMIQKREKDKIRAEILTPVPFWGLLDKLLTGSK